MTIHPAIPLSHVAVMIAVAAAIGAMLAVQIVSGLKQAMIGIPHYCRRCDELLADGQMVCPFCDHDATPIDEAAREQWLEDNGQFGVGA